MNELAIKDSNTFSESEINTIKQTIAPNLNNEELSLFVSTCKRTGLDPFSRQIYVTSSQWVDKRGQNQRKISIQATVDGFRVIAERSGKYAGQVGPLWCGNDGVWVDVWLKREPPSAAKVGVLRQDFKEPIWAVALYESYRQDRSPVWDKMPEQMLAKCAESLALRKAFPNDLSGIYSQEEMAQAENVRDVKPDMPQFAPTLESHRVNQSNESLLAPEMDDPPWPDEENASHQELVNNDIGEYVITFGKMMKGKRLKDIPTEQLRRSLNWVLHEANKPLSKSLSDFAEHADAYLKTQTN